MVDEEIVVDKLRHINTYTNDLKQIRGITKETYVADMVTQRAVERTFLNLIQSCIDLAQHIRATERLTPTGTSKRSATLGSSRATHRRNSRKPSGSATSSRIATVT